MSEVRSFASRSSSRGNQSRNISPDEISRKLYAEGMKAIKNKNYISTTKEIGKIDFNYTFKPVLNQKSVALARVKEQRHSVEEVAEVLHKEKLKKEKR